MVYTFWKNCGKIWKNGRFSGRLGPDLGNNARAATAGLGPIGLKWQKGKRKFKKEILLRTLNYKIGLYGKL